MIWFEGLPPVCQGLLATLFTYAVTAAGAALVFFFREVNQKALDAMMGFAAGVMIAASFWSLLSPAIELSAELGKNAWATAAAGFSAGGMFIIISDLFLSAMEARRGPVGKNRRSLLLITAVTLHNIPEGLAVGVAFGCVSLGVPGADLVSAVMLAVGIGLQNFPEGTCVAMPLRQAGSSPLRCFLAGQASGLVEPVAGVLGVICALGARQILPVALTFSAGAMIAVVCSELIPEAFRVSKAVATAGVLAGFVVMMVLDVALG